MTSEVMWNTKSNWSDLGISVGSALTSEKCLLCQYVVKNTKDLEKHIRENHCTELVPIFEALWIEFKDYFISCLTHRNRTFECSM